jgi:hypothetical protein
MTKKQRLSLTLVFSLQASLALAAEVPSNCSVATGSPDSAKCSVGTPAAVSAASPVASVPASTPVAPLSEDEKKKLTSEYKKALSNERSAFNHQERSALRELRVAQNQKQRRWREEQKVARRKYFDEHMSGPERREYVQAYLKKKLEFENSQKAEYAEAKKSWSAKHQALKQSQKSAEEKFHQDLNQGIRPSVDLWPKAH